MEKLTLASHFNKRNIIRQCSAPILMMLFISIYGMVDGLFIANIVGDDAFAGVNLIFPVICIVGGAGFMLGSGGSALTSKLLGEKKGEEANKVFSMMIYFGFLLGLVLSVIAYFFIEKLVHALASISTTTTPEMEEYAIRYGTMLIFSQPFFIVGNLFQNFFVVNEKQKLGFLFTLAAGVSNMIFDAILVPHFGVEGAAAATMLGHFITAVGPLVYFLVSKKNLINLVKTPLNFRIIGKCCFNGLSDFIFNISANIIGILYNIQLLKYIGQIGVSAYGVLMYTSFVFISIFIGISIGMAPVIGYNFGAQNHKELKNVIKNVFIIISAISVLMVSLSFLLAKPITTLFADEQAIRDLSKYALRIYCFSFLFTGFNIFMTGMFTALNNGVISGLLSLFRSFIFQIVFISVLPLIFKDPGDGIWASVIFAESFSFILSFAMYFAHKKKYHY